MSLWETYDEFVDKFKPKLTTDDCYTPPPVYKAVAGWVSECYGISEDRFVRPFFPGGDFQAAAREMRPGEVVVDNPPFSILNKIICYYLDNGIEFFLFAPHLTLFSGRSRWTEYTRIVTGVSVTFENGARLRISFVSNIETAQSGAVICTSPELFYRVHKAAEEYRDALKKHVRRLAWPANVANAGTMGKIARLPFMLTARDCWPVGRLDGPAGAKGKHSEIFGGGVIMSDERAREFARLSERAAVMGSLSREEATQAMELSPREEEIVACLNRREEIPDRLKTR